MFGYVFSLLAQRKCIRHASSIILVQDYEIHLWPSSVSCVLYPKCGIRRINETLFAFCCEPLGLWHKVNFEANAMLQLPIMASMFLGCWGYMASSSSSRSWSTSWVRYIVDLYLPLKKRPTLRANDNWCCFGFVHSVPKSRHGMLPG